MTHDPRKQVAPPHEAGHPYDRDPDTEKEILAKRLSDAKDRIAQLEDEVEKLSAAAEADDSTLRWLARRFIEESVANNRIRHAAQKMLDVCFEGHRVVERGADTPLMKAAENLKDALDAAEDGQDE